MKKRISALLLALAAALLSGCGGAEGAADLMRGVQPKAVSVHVDPTGPAATAAAEFSVELLQNSAASGENTLLSPVSVLCALAMTANGARGGTLAQMEEVFGASLPELNRFLGAYLGGLPSAKNTQLRLANSIWLRDDDTLKVERSFLQSNADYYGAAAYRAPFDGGTLKAVNGWVRDCTDGQIHEILDEISPDAVMYLVNALAFDAEWENIYREDQVRDGVFTTEAGKTRDAELLYGTEHRYLEGGGAAGFLKYYEGRGYAFAALLPDEGVPLSDYIASLTGPKLLELLQNPQDTEVFTAIPKFGSEYSAELGGVLQAMGMTDAFDMDRADFTGLGTSENGNLYIGRVLHKTRIAVDERGTKAGAASAVEARVGSAALVEPKTVHLNRPFVYLLLDCETSLPLFIGVMADIGQ